jgi:hypothetical protein
MTTKTINKKFIIQAIDSYRYESTCKLKETLEYSRKNGDTPTGALSWHNYTDPINECNNVLDILDNSLYFPRKYKLEIK